MKVYELSDEVLAEEVLADETLSSDATKTFVKRMRNMKPIDRKKFLGKFNPRNRMKLVKSVKSAAKLNQLNRQQVKSGIMDECTVSGFPGMDGDGGLYGKVKKKRAAKKTAKKEAKAAGQTNKQAKQAGKAAKKTVAASLAKPGSLKQQKKQAQADKAKAKQTGDKAALAKAKKASKAVTKERAKKVGKGFARFNPVMAAGRGAFLGLVMINLRGFADKMAKLQTQGKLGEVVKKWEAIGGKKDKLENAIKKGKGKKAKLGGGIKDFTDADFIEVLSDERDEILAGYGINIEPATGATLSAASSVMAIIVPVLTKLFKGQPEENELQALKAGVESPETKGKVGNFIDKAKNFFAGKGKSKASQVVGSALGAAGAAGVDLLEDRFTNATTGEEPDSNNEGEGMGSGTMIAVGLAGALGLGYLATRGKSK